MSITAEVSAEVLSFRVAVKLPSLENYRGRGRGASREQRDVAARLYGRIVDGKELIGWVCRQQAREGQLKRIYGRPVAVYIELHHQTIDADNTKLVVDALKRICYPDDRKEWVKQVCSTHIDNPAYEQPTVVVRVEIWE